MTSLDQAVSTFGKNATAKLNNPAITGAPEDQLRGPLEALMVDLAGIAGHADGVVRLVGETTLSESRTRPDYAVTVRNGWWASSRSRRRARAPTRPNSAASTTRPSGSG